MAQDSKDGTKSTAAKKPKPAEKSAEKPAAKVAKPAGASAAKASAKAKGKATPAVTDGGVTCRADKCKQPVRAKGYCRKHYIAWRRAAVGDHHRYKICSKEACRKPRTKGGLCDEHAGVASAAAPAEGAPAA
ncbi:MAG TPA: hypothetical protein VI456_16220 [Polyangia bacterium]